MDCGPGFVSHDDEEETKLPLSSDSGLRVALDVPWSRIQHLVQESDSIIQSTTSLLAQTPDCSIDDYNMDFCQNCDAKYQILKEKLGETQKQLTVAVSSNYTKNIMIEQLDKTLSKIVEGWKKLEIEKAAQIQKFESERDCARDELKREQEVLITVEQELTLTLDKLMNSQKEIEQVHNEKETWIADYENKVRILTDEVTLEKNKNAALISSIKKIKDELEKRIQEINNKFNFERQEWKFQEDKYKNQVKALQAELHATREGHVQVDQSMKTMNIQLEMLNNQLEEVVREKEGLKIEISILNARNAAEKTEVETKHQEMLEIQAKQHAKEIKNQQMKLKTEFELAAKQIEVNYHTTLEEVLQRKKNEDAKERENLEQELNEKLREQAEKLKQHFQMKEAEFEEQEQSREERMNELICELSELKKENSTLSSSRSQLMARIQVLLQNQWEESLKILYGSTESSIKLNLPQSPNDFLNKELDYLPCCEMTKRQLIHRCDSNTRKSTSQSNSDTFMKRKTLSRLPDRKIISNQRLSFQNLPDKPKVVKLSPNQTWTEGEEVKNSNMKEENFQEKTKMEERNKSTSPHPSEVMSDSTSYLRPSREINELGPRNSSPVVDEINKIGDEEMSKCSDCSENASEGAEKNIIDDGQKFRVRSPLTSNSKNFKYEERQGALKKYLAKLLQRPPGEPCDVNDELWPCKDEGSLKKIASRQKQAQVNCKNWIENSKKVVLS